MPRDGVRLRLSEDDAQVLVVELAAAIRRYPPQSERYRALFWLHSRLSAHAAGVGTVPVSR